MDDRIFVNYGMDDRTLLMGRAVAHSHSHTRKIMASTSAASLTENSVADVRRLAIHFIVGWNVLACSMCGMC